MRSHLIYGALTPVQNRYMLCQLVSKATRKFHRPTTRVQDTMNNVLVRFSEATDPETVMGKGEGLAELQTKAA